MERAAEVVEIGTQAVSTCPFKDDLWFESFMKGRYF